MITYVIHVLDQQESPIIFPRTHDNLSATGGPGNAFRFDAPEEHHERQEVLAAQHFIKGMCGLPPDDTMQGGMRQGIRNMLLDTLCFSVGNYTRMWDCGE